MEGFFGLVPDGDGSSVADRFYSQTTPGADRLGLRVALFSDEVPFLFPLLGRH